MSQHCHKMVVQISFLTAYIYYYLRPYIYKTLLLKLGELRKLIFVLNLFVVIINFTILSFEKELVYVFNMIFNLLLIEEKDV